MRIIVLIVLVKLTSKGPVLFKQRRIGIYKSEFEINSFTYVGTAISLNKLKETGLPKKDYFI